MGDILMMGVTPAATTNTTGWGLNNRFYFLTFLGGGSPRSRCQQGGFPLRPLSVAGYGRLPPVSSEGLPLRTSVPNLQPPLYKDTGRTGGPTHMTSF